MNALLAPSPTFTDEPEPRATAMTLAVLVMAAAFTNSERTDMSDPFDSWRRALAGEKPGIHDGEVWCGYFRVRDRRGAFANVAPVKRPWIACAIWQTDDGTLVAELGREAVPVERVWPWCAKYPLTWDAYSHWHQHGRWVDADAA